MEVEITSTSNKVIKEIKSLHRKRDRWNKRRFFIEGVKSLDEALKTSSDILYIIYGPSLFDMDNGHEMYNKIVESDIDIYKTTDKILKDISDTENPQGIIGVLSFQMEELHHLLNIEDNFIIVLDKVQDPGNLGTIIRSADALGAKSVIVTKGCVDIFNPKVIRSTMGSIFHMPVTYCEDIMELILKLKKKDINVITTSFRESIPCYKMDFNRDFALIIGNESKGVSMDIIESSDYLVKIPMIGDAESLNAAMASSILMYEAFRQRHNF